MFNLTGGHVGPRRGCRTHGASHQRATACVVRPRNFGRFTLTTYLLLTCVLSSPLTEGADVEGEANEEAKEEVNGVVKDSVQILVLLHRVLCGLGVSQVAPAGRIDPGTPGQRCSLADICI